MKWLFYVIVFIYMAYRAVYGAKVSNEVTIDKINYGNDTFFTEGSRRTINCKASSRNQRLEWLDPQGNSIKRVPTNRMFTQEYFVPNAGRVPGLMLTFSDLQYQDTGVYQCKSGTQLQDVALCVIKPAEFIDTPTEVIAELGRSITLTCQAKGNPEPIISWTRNSEEISEQNDTSKYRMNTKYNSQGYESLLTIVSLEPEDNGVYSCEQMQETNLPGCTHSASLNITLQISHAPVFENGESLKSVYGKTNEIVDLVCSASGFPPPSYRWFKVVNGNTMAEFDKKQIKFSEDENQAVLSVTASPTTFGQTYKCTATNKYDEVEKYFKLMKVRAPEKPSKVKFVFSTHNHIEFLVTWFDELSFPVKGFQVQYLILNKKPKEADWKNAIEEFKEVDDALYGQFLGLLITIEKLEEDSSYWVRVKATNEAGEAPWSDPAYAETDPKPEVEEDVDEEEQPVAAEVSSDATFYGIFFAGGIAVVAVACMFAMRLV